MGLSLKSEDSTEELYKLITEEPPKNPNDWQNKAIRLLALNSIAILQKIDKLDFRVRLITYLFTGIFGLMITLLINLLVIH